PRCRGSHLGIRMPASRRDENRLPSAVLVLFVLAAVTTFGVSLSSMLSVRLLSESNTSVSRAHTLLDDLAQLRTDLLSSQQARAAYRLNPVPEAGAAFERDEIAVRNDVQALASLSASEPEQAQRVADLAP